MEFLDLLPTSPKDYLWAGATFLLKHFWDKHQNKKQKIATADENSYTKLIEELDPIPNFPNFLIETDFFQPFQTDRFHNFKFIANKYVTNPDLRFLDENTHKKLIEINQKLDALLELFGLKTFPHRGGAGQTILRLKYGDIKDDFETGELLKKLSKEIKEHFDSFSISCRKK